MAEQGYTVAIVGATGLVGREMLQVLEERRFPVAQLRLLASTRSAGERLVFAEQEHRVELAHADSFAGVDIALMSAGSAASAAFAPLAAAAGALVIDNSAHFRLHAEVPLVVPEVNAAALWTSGSGGRIVANPNCSTIQLVLALAPLHRAVPLRRLVLATYQAVSGRGKRGLDELGDQVRALYAQDDIIPSAFPRRIAFNCLPVVGALQADGGSAEEHKLRHETRKILAAPGLGVAATCVRVPVFNGHSIAVHAEFAAPLSVATARQLLAAAPGVRCVDQAAAELYPTPVDTDHEGAQDVALVGRLRADDSCPHGLALWCVADNIRRGAATNAVLIAEAWARGRPS